MVLEQELTFHGKSCRALITQQIGFAGHVSAPSGQDANAWANEGIQLSQGELVHECMLLKPGTVHTAEARLEPDGVYAWHTDECSVLPVVAATNASGSSWLVLRDRKMSAVECKDRDQIKRRRGKCSVSSTSLLMRLSACIKKQREVSVATVSKHAAELERVKTRADKSVEATELPRLGCDQGVNCCSQKFNSKDSR